MVTEIQKTLVRQVQTLGLKFKMAVAETDGTTVHFKNSTMKKTTSVNYNEGLDLYEVSLTVLTKDYEVVTTERGVVFADQLPNVWM